MARYAAARLEKIEHLVDDRCLYRPVRLQLGITAFGATVWSGPAAGDLIVDEHDPGDPTSDQELFVVLRGHAGFELDGERVDAPAGTFVFAPPGVKRRAVAEEAGTEILLVEGTPGKAYQPRGWELWAPVAPLYASGHYTEVADRLRVAIEQHPEYALLYFNLACCESLTGRTTDALQHLGHAIELAEEFRDYAKDDADLQAIREEPAFRELVGD
jgi:tetratricopeptide (TPR) repeat protein